MTKASIAVMNRAGAGRMPFVMPIRAFIIFAVSFAAHCGQHGQERTRKVAGVKQGYDLRLSEILAKAAPILLAAVVIALSKHLAGDQTGWAGFAPQLALVAAVLLPAAAAHLAAGLWRPAQAVLVWLGGFVVYPLVLSFAAQSSPLAPWHWAVAGLLSLAHFLLHPGARSHGPGREPAAAPILRLPITLDGTMAALLGLWTLGSTSLFASTPDAVRNQPLRVWMDWRRMAANPGETLGYLVQFAVLAGMLFAWYWICRYVLVRRVLHRQGIVPFAYAIAALIAIGAPLVASIGLLLPLNIPEWAVIPSENHNAFDWTNFSFAIWLTAVLLPIILAVERLQAEQAQADNRHEQVRAELYTLQQQIQPHFLFNTLNTLYALSLKDRSESAAAIVKLSDLLRYAVYRGQDERVPIDEEIAYLSNYLDLQQLRFGHRCVLTVKWPEPGSRLALPPLLLIMLVENAFKHGVEPAEGACTVRISAIMDGARLRFECTNSLPPLSETGEPGMGLANLRRRLELLFGAQFTLEAIRTGEEWQARLELDLAPC